MSQAIALDAVAAPEAPGGEKTPPRCIALRHTVMVWLPVIVACVATAGSWNFVSHAVASNPILNALILLMLIWGIATMVGHLRRLHVEDRVFREGIVWLRSGAYSGLQDPGLGPQVCITGMLERLNKLGLGHQLSVHSSAMEPEFEALEHALAKRQDLSQYLVGLMIGLGLLGTFVGLLETLVKTSELVGDIASSTGGGGAAMEENFSRIVGGLQRPLSAMGTAFSASMFGLVGSILLGFQLVAVRKATSDFIEAVRHQVLSLAERSKATEKVEITERFLATVLADVLEHHRLTTEGLAATVKRLDIVVPAMHQMAQTAVALMERLDQQSRALDRVSGALEGTAEIVPVLRNLADTVGEVTSQVEVSNVGLGQVLPTLTEQVSIGRDLQTAVARMESLGKEMSTLNTLTAGLRTDVQHQSGLMRRLDTALWNSEKDQMRSALAAVDAPGT